MAALHASDCSSVPLEAWGAKRRQLLKFSSQEWRRSSAKSRNGGFWKLAAATFFLVAGSSFGLMRAAYAQDIPPVSEPECIPYYGPCPEERAAQQAAEEEAARQAAEEEARRLAEERQREEERLAEEERQREEERLAEEERQREEERQEQENEANMGYTPQ